VHGQGAPAVEHQHEEDAHLLGDYDSQLLSHRNYVNLQRLGVGWEPLGHQLRPLVVHLGQRHAPLNTTAASDSDGLFPPK
jgi:hypothetical protein